MFISYAKTWANSFNLDKRTTRSEYFAFYFLDLIILGLISALVFTDDYSRGDEQIAYIGLFWFYLLGGFIPRVTCLIRRIKDTGRSTGWIFWSFVPFLGTLVLLVIALQPSSKKRKDSFPIEVTDTVPVQLVNSATSNSDKESLKSKLEELKKLKKEGLISDEEYEKLRQKNLEI